MTRRGSKNKPHGVQHRNRRPKVFDTGKAQALRDAGWDPERIAGELFATTEEVLANTREPIPRKRYEHEWREQEPGYVKAPTPI